MSELPDLPEIHFCGAEESCRRRAAYAAKRRAYRLENPDRNFEITPLAVYLAPPELRVNVGGSP